MQVWSAGAFPRTSEHIVELIKPINNISQTDIVQLIFKSQPGSVLHVEDQGRSSNLKAEIAPFSN